MAAQFRNSEGYTVTLQSTLISLINYNCLKHAFLKNIIIASGTNKHKLSVAQALASCTFFAHVGTLLPWLFKLYSLPFEKLPKKNFWIGAAVFWETETWSVKVFSFSLRFFLNEWKTKKKKKDLRRLRQNGEPCFLSSLLPQLTGLWWDFQAFWDSSLVTVEARLMWDALHADKLHLWVLYFVFKVHRLWIFIRESFLVGVFKSSLEAPRGCVVNRPSAERRPDNWRLNLKTKQKACFPYMCPQSPGISAPWSNPLFLRSSADTAPQTHRANEPWQMWSLISECKR